MSKIVLIDDAPEQRVLVTTILRATGHEVAAAASTDEGMTLLGRWLPDVILLDLEMPVKDGVACLALIRAQPEMANLPVLMVTGTPVREVVLRIAKLGVQGIVSKDGNYMQCLKDRIVKVLASPAAGPSTVSAARSEEVRLNPAHPAQAMPHSNLMPICKSQYYADEGPVGSGRPASVSAKQGAIPIRTSDQAGDQLGSMKPLAIKSEMLEKLIDDSVAVRALKPAVQQVLRVLDSPDCSAQRLASAIRQDQALSIRIVKVANSSLYGRGDYADSVLKAVSRIGVEQIRATVLSVEIVDAFSKVVFQNRIQPEWFWEHAITVGVLATRLSQLSGQNFEKCDTAFTAGLLHDIGRLVLAEHASTYYAEVIATADKLELPLEQVETRLLQMNHAYLTDRLLRSWMFPADLVSIVSLHHLGMSNLKHVAPRLADEGAVLALANGLAHTMLLGTSGNDALYPLAEYADFLRLDTASVVDLCTTADAEVADLRSSLFAMGSGDVPCYADQVRNAWANVRPSVLTTEPFVDPVTMFLSRVAGGVDRPNLLVLRVRTPEERTEATRLLASHDLNFDPDHDTGPLPVLVVADSSSCLCKAGALGNRVVGQVVLPICLSRLLREAELLIGG